MLRNLISRNAIWCCCVKRKGKTAVHHLRRHAPYSVVEKKGTIVMVERVSDGRTVVRNTNDFNGYSAPTQEQT